MFPHHHHNQGPSLYHIAMLATLMEQQRMRRQMEELTAGQSPSLYSPIRYLSPAKPFVAARPIRRPKRYLGMSRGQWCILLILAAITGSLLALTLALLFSLLW